jgi:dephospho-CoA kinase
VKGRSPFTPFRLLGIPLRDKLFSQFLTPFFCSGGAHADQTPWYTATCFSFSLQDGGLTVSQIKLGLVGTNGSGKSSASSYLVEKGFVWLSLSDVVRQTVAQKGLSESRETLIATANQLKLEHGQDFLAREAFKSAEALGHPLVVFDSIRNIAEVHYLVGHGVQMIGIDASTELRFSRISSRRRPGDDLDFETFKRLDDQENHGQSSGQNIYAAMAACQEQLTNSGELSDFLTQLDRIVAIAKGSHYATS